MELSFDKLISLPFPEYQKLNNNSYIGGVIIISDKPITVPGVSITK